MKTCKVGDRVVVRGLGTHGTVIKVRADDRGEALIDVQLDKEKLTWPFGDQWVARIFELEEEV